MAGIFERVPKAKTTVSNQAMRGVYAEPTSDNFEQLLADLSASFIRSPAESIDNQIELWLKRVVLCLALDRGTLTQFDSTDGGLWVTHQWARNGIPTPDRGVNIRQHLPWLAERIASDEPVVYSNLPQELPHEAVRERQFAQIENVKSHITLPLKIGGNVVGGVSFATLDHMRTWSQQDVRRLKLVAEVFGNALERKRSFAEHRRLEEDLRKMEGVALIGEFAAVLAHELKQPLAAILSNAETAYDLVKAENPDLSEIGETLTDIMRDDARADEIVRNVRSMFQRGEGKKSSVDIREVFLDIERIVGMSARTKGVSLSINIPDFPSSVLGDRTQLTQATLNLITNAFDAACGGETPREVSLSAAQVNPDRVRVSVQDSGKGIDPRIASRLFQPFFTTKSTGMGMGLAIVRSIIENHGGKIWASQNPERGATFEFELPREGKD